MASMMCGEKFLALCLQPARLIARSAWSVLPHGAPSFPQLPTVMLYSGVIPPCSLVASGRILSKPWGCSYGKHPTCWQTRRHKLGWCNSDVFRLLGWIVQTEMETSPPCRPASPPAPLLGQALAIPSLLGCSNCPCQIWMPVAVMGGSSPGEQQKWGSSASGFEPWLSLQEEEMPQMMCPCSPRNGLVLQLGLSGGPSQ